jgi:hypothetical protein
MQTKGETMNTNTKQSNQTAKTFEQILQEHDYKYTGSENLVKLNDACNEYLAANGPIWYADFNIGLSAHLKKMFKDKKILTHSPLARNPRWFSKPDVTEEEKERFLEDRAGKIESRLNYKGILELERLREYDFNTFKIDNIYSLLRRVYNLAEKDGLDLEFPKGLITNDNFEKVKEKANALYDKRINVKKEWSKAGFRRTLEEITPGEMHLGDIYVSVPEYCKISDDSWSMVDSNLLLGNIYLKLANKIPIAYQSEESAIKFFENEVGINLSKPKEHKIYSFSERV